MSITREDNRDCAVQTIVSPITIRAELSPFDNYAFLKPHCSRYVIRAYRYAANHDLSSIRNQVSASFAGRARRRRAYIRTVESFDRFPFNSHPRGVRSRGEGGGGEPLRALRNF